MRVDIDGDGDIGLGDVLPEAYLFKAAAEARSNDQVGVALGRGTLRGIVLEISFAATV